MRRSRRLASDGCADRDGWRLTGAHWGGQEELRATKEARDALAERLAGDGAAGEAARSALQAEVLRLSEALAEARGTGQGAAARARAMEERGGLWEERAVELQAVLRQTEAPPPLPSY